MSKARVIKIWEILLGGHEVGSTALGQQVTQGAHGRTQKEGK